MGNKNKVSVTQALQKIKSQEENFAEDEKQSRIAPAKAILKSVTQQQAAAPQGQIILKPEEVIALPEPAVKATADEDEDVLEQKVQVTEDEDIQAVEEDEDDAQTTIGELFLNRVFKVSPSMAHRMIADLIMTELSEVSDSLREWYIKQQPASFADYETAKDSTFQYLIKEYEQFDTERQFAHAVAHWFVNSLGIRKQR